MILGRHIRPLAGVATPGIELETDKMGLAVLFKPQTIFPNVSETVRVFLLLKQAKQASKSCTRSSRVMSRNQVSRPKYNHFWAIFADTFHSSFLGTEQRIIASKATNGLLLTWLFFILHLHPSTPFVIEYVLPLADRVVLFEGQPW